MTQLQVTSPEGREYTVELRADRVTIGRAPTCEVRLPVRSVSLRHAEIVLAGSAPLLIDLGSTNGVLLNDKLVAPHSQTPLRDGDRLELGTFRLVFQTDSDPIALARAPRVAPSLAVVNGPQAGLVVSLGTNREATIGRGEECALRLIDAGASRRHALLCLSLDGASITDLGSRHGTQVDGLALPANSSVRLRDRSEVTIGQTRLSYTDPAEAPFASLSPVVQSAPLLPPKATPQAPLSIKVVLPIARFSQAERWLLWAALLCCLGAGLLLLGAIR